MRKPHCDISFLQSIQDLIDQGHPHKDHLHQVIESYNAYLTNFSTYLLADTSLHCFRVTYDNADVWFDVTLSGSDTFYDFALTIVKTMGWINDHLHGFDFDTHNPLDTSLPSIPSNACLYSPDWDDDQYPVVKTSEVTIGSVNYERLPKFDFTFDYGDCHDFTITYNGIPSSSFAETTPFVGDIHGTPPEQYPEY